MFTSQRRGVFLSSPGCSIHHYVARLIFWDILFRNTVKAADPNAIPPSKMQYLWPTFDPSPLLVFNRNFSPTVLLLLFCLTLLFYQF